MVTKNYGPVINQGRTVHASPGVQTTPIGLDPAGAGSNIGKYFEYGVLVKRTAHILYDFAVDGGVIGAIVPVTNILFPANAIIVGGIMNVVTAPVGTGATISVGTDAGSDAATILAATAITAMTLDIVTELLGNNSQAATQKAPFKLSAAGHLQLTLAVHALTAGKIEFFIDYYHAANA